mgnify:FL=1
MSNCVDLAFATPLTPLYLVILGSIAAAVVANILRERRLVSQIVGGMVLIPLILRLLLVK